MAELGAILESLQAIGMSGYEAKAYIALLGSGEPINGYEVAKRSGVPRSTVYEALGKLVMRGAAFEIRSETNQTLYIALPPQSLVQRIGRTFEGHLDRLSDLLPSVSEPPRAHLVHNVYGREAVMERAADLILQARRELYVSAWAEDLERLRVPLQRAERGPAEVVLLRYGHTPADIPSSYEHVFSSPDAVTGRLGYRLLIVSPDGESVLVSGAAGNSTWGLYSDHPAVVLVAIDYIRHDIAHQVLVQELGMDRVREIISTHPTLRRLETAVARPPSESGPAEATSSASS